MHIKRLIKSVREHNWDWREIIWVLEAVVIFIVGIKLTITAVFVLGDANATIMQTIGLVIGGIVFIIISILMLYGLYVTIRK